MSGVFLDNPVAVQQAFGQFGGFHEMDDFRIQVQGGFGKTGLAGLARVDILQDKRAACPLSHAVKIHIGVHPDL